MKNPTIKPYTCKVIKSGDVIEIYRYNDVKYKITREIENETIENIERLGANEVDEKAIIKIKEVDSSYTRRKENIYKTKSKLKRLINSNVNQFVSKDKFITLNFAKYLNRDEVMNCFEQFNKRLRRAYKDYDYGYIAIIERGTQGTKRLHLHCLFFGLPYIKIYEFKKIWKYGTVDMQAIENYYDISNYILKYIEKTLETGAYIPKGSKFYLSSRNLKKCEELFYSDEDLKNFLENNEDKDFQVVYRNEYESEHVGEYEYIKLRPSKDLTKSKQQIDYEYYIDHIDEINDEQADREIQELEFKNLFGE